MRKINKRGFTLIELLAVIIILGVLMIIAIPAVTSYIQNSRKSAYIDTGESYIKAVVNKVNDGQKLQFFTEEVLYLVPVGHEAEHTCVSVESGGQSPFNSTWNWAYVGVTYKGQENKFYYYYLSEDGAGQGIEFKDQKTLNDSGTDLMYTKTKAKDPGYDILKTQYAQTANKVYSSSDDDTKDDFQKLAAILPTTQTYSSVVIIGVPSDKLCKFSNAEF